MVRVNVNRHIVISNHESGSRDAPLSIIRDGIQTETAHTIKLIGDAVLMYRADEPAGFRVWIEADDAVAV